MITPREMQIAYETGLFYYIFSRSAKCLAWRTSGSPLRPMHDARRATAKPETPEIRRHSGKRRLHLLQRKPPRPERSQRYSGARGSGNAAISTYSPIAPPRSGSTRPGPEIRFYSLAPYFGLPDIRHNEARSALSKRSDVRQCDFRTGPDHRTNYPNIAGRNAEGRGGYRHGESGRGHRFRTARLRQRTCRSSPHRNPRGLRNPPASRHATPSSGIRPASCYRCTRRPSRSSDAHKLVRKTHSQPPFPNFRPIHKT